MEIIPLNGNSTFGARVRGVGIDVLSQEENRFKLRELLVRYGLLIFEEVEPSHHLQIAIGEIFGRVKSYPSGECVKDESGEIPGVGTMTSAPGSATVVEIYGKRLSGWMPWHFDQCYNQHPNSARVLRCGQLACSGGLTGFLDGVELHRRFDRSLLEKCSGLKVCYEHNLSIIDLRFGAKSALGLSVDACARLDRPSERKFGAAHQAIRPTACGELALHVSPWMATGIYGQQDSAGDALLDDISDKINELAKVLSYYHPWKLTDMLVWDNLRMLHSSTGFDPAETRVMYRTTILAE